MITTIKEWKKFKLNEDSRNPDDWSIGGDLNLTNAKMTSSEGLPNFIGGHLSKEQISSLDYDRICML
jgi:hypothetical protein